MGAERPEVVVAGGTGEADEWPSPADELFARLVHDLRNPLGIIAAFAETLADAPTEEHAELCERVRVNAERALHVLEELSLLADLRAGHAERADLEDADLGELLDRVAGTMERHAERIRRTAGGSRRALLPGVHLACALRSVLRQVVHETAPDDDIELTASIAPPALSIRVAVATPLRGLDVELADAVASLYGGRCEIASQATTLITLTIVAAGRPARQ